jgi:hypothetical protein
VLAILWERRRTAVMVFGVVAALAFLFFYPYVSGVPVPGELGSVYQILPTWAYDPTFYPTDSCPTPVSASTASSVEIGIAWIFELATLALTVAVAIAYEPARRLLARVGVI